jgi:putative metallohydrolase (TIGR04338 family)
MNLVRAIAEMTALASRAETPNERAKTGMAGARMPKPMETKKAMADSTATSVGRSRSNGDLCTRWCGRQEVISAHSILEGVSDAGGLSIVDRDRALVYSTEDAWSKLLDRGGRCDFFGSIFTLPNQRTIGDLATMQQLVDHWLSSSQLQQAFPGLSGLRVRARQGQTKAHYEPAGIVAIPLEQPWACKEAVLAHEVAHHCSWSPDLAPHGAQFRGALIQVAQVAFGQEAALVLRAAYDGAGLEVTHVP